MSDAFITVTMVDDGVEADVAVRHITGFVRPPDSEETYIWIARSGTMLAVSETPEAIRAKIAEALR